MDLLVGCGISSTTKDLKNSLNDFRLSVSQRLKSLPHTKSRLKTTESIPQSISMDLIYQTGIEIPGWLPIDNTRNSRINMDFLVSIPVRVLDVDGREKAYADKRKRNFFNPCKGFRLTRAMLCINTCHKLIVPG